MPHTIYLDNASTTKPNKISIDAINKVLHSYWMNPSSPYSGARKAKKLMEYSRLVVKKAIHATEMDQIIFVSSGCEANSLAINGFMECNGDFDLIIDQTSHSSIKSNYNYPRLSMKHLPDGTIDIENLEYLLKSISKPFVSITGANNEIGTIQDIKKIANIVHKHNGVLHVDAVQLFANQNINVQELGIDLMSISGHKIGCPSGIGALFLKEGISIFPLIYGTQENHLRGGTENLAFIYAFAECISELENNRKDIHAIIKANRDYFIECLFLNFNNIELIGSRSNRLANNITILFKGIDAKNIIMYLDNHDICVSGGSACSSHSNNSSEVLKAIGLQDEDMHSVVRFTLNNQINACIIRYVIFVLRSYYNLIGKDCYLNRK